MPKATTEQTTLWYHKKNWAIACFLLIAATLAYALFPTRFFFLNDDFIHIPMASDGTIGHHNGARHMNDLSLYLDYLWSGDNAVGYHITNALLHIGDILLLRLLLLKISTSLGIAIPRNVVLAMVGLFAVFAIHTEALFWILCRTATLSMLFVLLCWLFVFGAAKNSWLIIPAIGCYIIALFTYETSWLLPVYLLVWWWLSKKTLQQHRQYTWPIVAIWVVFIAYLPVRKWMIHEVIGGYEAGDIIQPNLLMIISKSARLFFRTFLPPISQTPVMTIASCMVLLVLGILCWQILKHKLANRLWWFLLSCWLISYLPFISLGVSATGYESDRYLYFASLFAATWLVFSLYLLTPFYPKVSRIAIVGLFIFHGVFLVKASNDYETAGKISASTMQLLQKNATNEQIDIYKLPATWKGIPIFRYGFKDALNWRLDSVTAKKITVRSTSVFTGATPRQTEHTISEKQVSIVFGQQ
ncbi:MAG TPA: hypothetical protein VLC98_02120 [Phnomibacter sp.]|nr:hypothetical protein [Phnomibacter sp.]